MVLSRRRGGAPLLFLWLCLFLLGLLVFMLFILSVFLLYLFFVAGALCVLSVTCCCGAGPVTGRVVPTLSLLSAFPSSLAVVFIASCSSALAKHYMVFTRMNAEKTVSDRELSSVLPLFFPPVRVGFGGTQE